MSVGAFTYNYPIHNPSKEEPPLTVRTFENFQNLTLLGSGGFGTVFLKSLSNSGYQNPVAKNLAIKITKFSNLFLEELANDEVLILQKIGKKPNLIVYLGAFHHPDYTSLTTEYVPGDTLTKICIEPSPYTILPRVFSIGRQIASALDALRKLKIVHGDLKPQNIMLNGDDVIIIDFGLAIDLEKKPCNHHNLYPMQYRPPEVILEALFTDNSPDVWASAHTLFSIFTKKFLITSSDSTGYDSKYNSLLAMKDLIGPPPLDFVQSCGYKQHFFKSNTAEFLFPNPIGRTTVPHHPDKFGLVDSTAQNHTHDSTENVAFFQGLLRKMLKWDPATRISPIRICEEIEQFTIQKS